MGVVWEARRLRGLTHMDTAGERTLYAGAILLSAFLLFQVEPIMGKEILPWFGGSAAVWTTSVVFFEVVLLLGYLYAHLLVRYLSARRQILVHAVVLLASVAVLPIVPAASWKPTGSGGPTLRILGLLAVTVGPPFFVLSTTGPLLQAWYARRRGTLPYRLFALSNAASVLGLITYPLLVEPHMATRHQASTWSIVYAVFVVVCIWVALGSGHGAPASAAAAAEAPAEGAPTLARHILWIALAAVPSLLFLALTNELSQNVAPIPFLWVLPLTLYLLSLILCFEGRRWYRRAIYLPLLPVALFGTAYGLFVLDQSTDVGIVTLISAYSAGLFICCMVCHGELARLKPHRSHLTAFYLMLSLGGAVGGLFVAVIAPMIFAGYFELPLGLFLCAALTVGLLAPGLLRRGPGALWRRPVFGVSTLGTVALGLYVLVGVNAQTGSARFQARNFYGSLIVEDREADGGRPATRVLTNGANDHGEQILAPAGRRTPTLWYGRDSGVGLALRGAAGRIPHRVGVIGLGAGTLAAYAHAGDVYRFYEINPQDVHIARTQFSFLRDTPARVAVVLGDARLALAREPSQQFDVLAADAFNGDTIPIHLLTVQAFKLYFRHLVPKTGMLAVHVSNVYLNLVPVVARAARTLHKYAVFIASNDDPAHATDSSDWVLLTGDPRAAHHLARAGGGKIVTAGRGVRLWTDDYSNLVQALM